MNDYYKTNSKSASVLSEFFKKTRFLTGFLMMFSLVANAQIELINNVDSNPSGWTLAGFSRTSSSFSPACQGSFHYYSNLYDFAPTGTITSPNQVGASNGQEISISFTYKANEWSAGAGTNSNIFAEYSTNNGSSWTQAGLTLNISGLGSVGNQFTVPCTVYNASIPAGVVPSGSDFRFRIRGAYVTGDGRYGIDLISVTQPVLDPPNCVTNLLPANGASNLPTNTTISWNATGATSFDVYFGTNPEPMLFGNFASLGAFQAAIPQVLMSNTTYYLQVVPINNNGSAVECPMVSFTTGDQLQYCTPTVATDASTFINNFSTSNAIANISNLSSGFSPNGYGNNYASQFVSLFAGDTFNWNMTIQGGTLGAAIWIDWNQNGVFETTERVFNTSFYGSGPYSGTITAPAQVAPGDYRMRVHVNYNVSNPTNPCGTTSTRQESEDYKLIVLPPATCPTPTNVATANIAATTVDISWVASEDADYYEIEYGEANFVQGSGILVDDADVTPYTLEGLDPVTNYHFYIRSVCADNNFGIWIGPFSFTTLATCPAPTNLTTSNLVYNSATINWVQLGGESLWEIQYGPNGFVLGEGNMLGEISTNPFTLSDLAGSTQYQVYVRTNCDGEDSTWSGPLSFTTPAPPPVNNLCANAIELTSCNGGEQTISGTTVNSTVNPLYVNCGNGGSITTERGVWYIYNGDNAQVTMNTCSATGYDSRLTVYSGSCGNFSCVVANDDMTADECSFSGLRSEVTFNALEGTTYYIFVHGYQSGTSLSATGSFVLNWSCEELCSPAPSNDTCATSIELIPGSNNLAPTAGFNSCANAAIEYPGCGSAFATYSGVWYEFEATSTTMVVNVNFANPLAFGMSLYSECGTSNLGCLAPGSYQSGTNVTLSDLVIGENYKLQVYSLANNTGEFSISLIEVPAATINPVNCESTINNLANDYFGAVTVVDAQEYEFRIQNGAFSDTAISLDGQIRFSDFEGHQFATTYDVSVRVKVAGVFGSFGPSCQITTPVAPIIPIEASYCNTIVENTQYERFYAEENTDATQWIFKIDNGTNSYEVTRNVDYAHFYDFAPNIAYGTTYQVSVSAKIGGAWTGFGPSCAIGITAEPKTEILYNTCGTTLPNIASNITLKPVDLANMYRMTIKNLTTNVEVSMDQTSRLFRISNFSNSAYNTAFEVKAQVSLDGGATFFAANTPCIITTPALPIVAPNLAPASCGITVPRLNADIYTPWVNDNAIYCFHVSVNGEFLEEKEMPTRRFRLTDLSVAPEMGVTYTLKVRIKLFNSYSEYGTSCDIFTPSVPLTQLSNATCNSNISGFGTTLRAAWVNSQVNAFMFAIVDGEMNIISEVERATEDVKLTMFPDFTPQLGTTYLIRVKVRIGNTWGEYGNTCSVTTPGGSQTVTRMIDEVSVFDVKAYPNPFNQALTLSIESSSDSALEVNVYDMTGKLVNNIKHSNGVGSVTIGEQLAAGVYHVQVVQDGNIKTLKVVKK